jgi:hypothetical protein
VSFSASTGSRGLPGFFLPAASNRRPRTTPTARAADRSVRSTWGCTLGRYFGGGGRIWLPFLVARILRGGMGQGAADLGRRVGVGCFASLSDGADEVQRSPSAGSGQAFDCASASLREADASLRMTGRGLRLIQRPSAVEAGSFWRADFPRLEIVPFPVSLSVSLASRYRSETKNNSNCKGSGQECPLHMGLHAWSLLRWRGEDLVAFSGGQDS